MATAFKICFQLEKEILRAVAKGESRLRVAGIREGAIVKHGWRGTFKISRVETRHYANYKSVSVSLHGYKMRKDTSFGQHEHYIGRAHEVELL